MGERDRGEELLALHDELDALSLAKSTLGFTVVFGFAAVLYFFLGLDMDSWKVVAGSLLSGAVAGGFAARDLRRLLRKRELRREMKRRSAWDLLGPAPDGGAGDGPGRLPG